MDGICTHILYNGLQCKRITDYDTPYCGFHVDINIVGFVRPEVRPQLPKKRRISTMKKDELIELCQYFSIDNTTNNIDFFTASKRELTEFLCSVPIIGSTDHNPDTTKFYTLGIYLNLNLSF